MTDLRHARAWEVLHGVLQELDFGTDPPDAVIGAWVEDENTICIIFEKNGCPTIGLRRELEPQLPADVLSAYIAFSELGEPLGSLWDETEVDAHGVHWFAGDHPEWRDYGWLERRPRLD